MIHLLVLLGAGPFALGLGGWVWIALSTRAEARGGHMASWRSNWESL